MERKPNTTVPTSAAFQKTNDPRQGVEDLRAGGLLSRRLPGYEERPAQIEMATIVAESIEKGVPAVLEAWTGTGKILSYLLPIVRSGKVAIISTANKALQEQLFYKDIPFLQMYIRFDAAMVKGVNNYVCLDRLEQERVGLQFYAQDEGFKKLVRKTQEPVTRFNGDFEALDFRLPGEIMHAVQGDSNQCSWSECGFFEDCYVRQMRERAEVAQIIVVNHTLLLLDAALGGGALLPERDVIVLDEVHNLEEEGTRAFTETVGLGQIEALLRLRRLQAHTPEKMRSEALREAAAVWDRLEAITLQDSSGRVSLTRPLEEGLRLASAISQLSVTLEHKKPRDMEKREAALYDKLVKQTRHLSEQLRLIFSVSEPGSYVYYVECGASSSVAGRPPERRLYACAAPLDVSRQLRETVFEKTNVICASATLATVDLSKMRKHGEKGASFAYFRRRVGLDYEHFPDVLERILPPTFDYEHNALLYLPTSLPQPSYSGTTSDDEYVKAIAREMYRLVRLSRGRAFLLFSSKRVLERAYELMCPHLDFPLLKQGDMTRTELVRRFREEPSILYGLKSFWEGVDIAGEALSLVVIDKLPFEPPNDPVNEARVAQMKVAGENWFGTYTLPQAVLRLKQGLGRLLRTSQDRGVMAILDTRLHSKGYGNLVIQALPNARRTSSIRDVQSFFQNARQ